MNKRMVYVDEIVRKVSLILAVLLAAVWVIPARAADGESVYTDIPGPGHWAHDGIHYVISEGLMTGTGHGSFSPKQATNRAMLATVLYRLAGSPEIGASANFKDVPKGAWYEKAVDWAYLNGVAGGYSETAFGPLNSLNREQAAVMLYSFVQAHGYSHKVLSLSDGKDVSLEAYRDSDQVSLWAIPAVEWSLNAGLFHGTRKGGTLLLDPKGTVTREQLAVILSHFAPLAKWPGNGDGAGTETNRLEVAGLLSSPSYQIAETDAALLEELLTDESWEKTEEFLEYPAAYAIHLGQTEYLLYVKDGAWLEQCGFITTQENGEKTFGGMTIADSTVLPSILAICQSYTSE